MLLLYPNLGTLIFAHVLHALPEALRPRNVANIELDGTFTILWARVENRLVVEVRYVLDLAQPSQHRLPLALSKLPKPSH